MTHLLISHHEYKIREGGRGEAVQGAARGHNRRRPAGARRFAALKVQLHRQGRQLPQVPFFALRIWTTKGGLSPDGMGSCIGKAGVAGVQSSPYNIGHGP